MAGREMGGSKPHIVLRTVLSSAFCILFQRPLASLFLSKTKSLSMCFRIGAPTCKLTDIVISLTTQAIYVTYDFLCCQAYDYINHIYIYIIFVFCCCPDEGGVSSGPHIALDFFFQFLSFPFIGAEFFLLSMSPFEKFLLTFYLLDGCHTKLNLKNKYI